MTVMGSWNQQQEERKREWRRQGLLLPPAAPTRIDADDDTNTLRKLFGEYYKVKKTSITMAKIHRLFRSGGVKPLDGQSNSEYHTSQYVESSPYFDHLEIWSWMTQPCILVGHPYPGNLCVRSDDPILNDRRIFGLCDKCGLDVFNFGADHSHYGFGTFQYLIFAHDFLSAVAERKSHDVD